MFIGCIYRISLSSDKLFLLLLFLIECLQFYCFFCWPYYNSRTSCGCLFLLRQIFSMESKTNKRDPGSCCLGFRLLSTKSRIIRFWSRADLRMHLKRVLSSFFSSVEVYNRPSHDALKCFGLVCLWNPRPGLVLGVIELTRSIRSLLYFLLSFDFPSLPFFLWLGDGLRWTRVY